MAMITNYKTDDNDGNNDDDNDDYDDDDDEIAWICVYGARCFEVLRW